MKRAPLLALVAAASVALATPAFAADEPVADGPAASYIVQFTPGSDRSAEVAKAKALGMTVTYEYTKVLNGMAVLANKGQLTALEKNPNVTKVEADGIATISDTQNGATWGIDRIDQASGTNGSYVYPTSAGAGVTAYIIDTGINLTHKEFTGRTLPGYDAVTAGGTAADCNGHGTHVAGTVAGTTYGVAKKATVVPVRVLGCTGSGSWSGVIAGIDWVANNARMPAVANMSLGGGYYATLNDAVTRAIASGVTFALAAGNETTDACSKSPASTPTGLTVAATQQTGDAQASYSNYGGCVDIYAPGSAITSAWYTSSTATNTISGTSMATPHVAGAAALYLGLNPTASPAAVANALTGQAINGAVTSITAGSPNKLLYTGALAGVAEPDTTPGITALSSSSGGVGTVVTITGRNFTEVSAVRFNGVKASVVTVDSDTQITASVPAGATTGPVSVTTAAGTAPGPTFTVPVIAAPAKPATPTATAGASGSRAATVTWLVPSDGGSPITSQTVRVFRGTSTSAWKTVTVTATATTYTVTGLTKGTSYRFTVSATNAQGAGPQSAFSNAVTAR